MSLNNFVTAVGVDIKALQANDLNLTQRITALESRPQGETNTDGLKAEIIQAVKSLDVI